MSPQATNILTAINIFLGISFIVRAAFVAPLAWSRWMRNLPLAH